MLEYLIPVCAGVLRNVAGWLEDSLKDGEIQSYEWMKLLSTTIQVVVLALSVHFGLGADLLTSSGIGILGSVGISTIRRIGR